jgi:DNA-binding beta-propeller fold protein YncE
LPSGIGFDNSGNIWVSDRMHHKIKKFNQSGDTLFQFGTRGSEYGEIKRPTGIALYDDKIYIAESRNRRISVFDTLGDFIRVIGESAGLLMPFGLVIDSTGCIFVSDFLGDRVIEFGPSGNQLLEIDSILDAPSGLALSSDANVLYVSDTRCLMFIRAYSQNN